MFSQRLSDSNTPVDSFLLGSTEGLGASIMLCWEIATDVKGLRSFHVTTSSSIIKVPTTRIFTQTKFEYISKLHIISVLRWLSFGIWCCIVCRDLEEPSASIFRVETPSSDNSILYSVHLTSIALLRTWSQSSLSLYLYHFLHTQLTLLPWWGRQ